MEKQGPNSTDSSGTKSNQDRPKNTTKSLLDWFPTITVENMPPGPNSRRADEHCIIYCTQTSRGRELGELPVCKSICLRMVRKHEIARHGNKVPLPSEGQPPEAVPNGRVEGFGARNVKYWSEGTYLFWSDALSAARERPDAMRRHLRRELQALRWKEQVVYEQKNNHESKDGTQADRASLRGPAAVDWEQVTNASRLIYLSSLPTELFDEFRKTSRSYLQSTARLLDLTGETVQELKRQRIPGQVWDSIRTGEAVSLLGSLMEKAWENLKPDDDGKK